MGFVQRIEENVVGIFQKKIAPALQLMTYYRCALMEVETKFKVLNEEFSLSHDRNPIEHIKTRIKTPESIRKKMRTLQIPKNVDSLEKNIHDIAGIRIICQFVDDIYVLADCLLAQDDVALIEKKDYIANPKESGYRSLHLIIEVPIFLHNEKRQMKVEVQLRTIAMDFWASLEHRLTYKKDINNEKANNISSELKNCAETSVWLDLKMQDIRNNIERIEKRGN
ncbi:RelA/SpoT domain protein [Treponema primitia ZAS-2]|uniref:RelA/SpoT domain protein n=1 Tax=Treponema primitia (strain ATCC BAA-887 / DSM 12427 / ZAS-2) TaxID=545694 RepID=F5YKB0_TREPZ|nr:GTP pyrophosphokinase family protein [Treponema primitia]AEF84654.1 RelA/SpoT domain protein [Treponema primitia ZAS-2]